jgi:predicted  nucleic acid-binding Zn-ribbon protein
MFTMTFDFLRWCFSKILVVLVIVIATIILAITYRYGAEQERLLKEKSEQMKILEQLRAEFTQATVRRREAADELKKVSDPLEGRLKQLDALKEDLKNRNQRFYGASQLLNKLKEDLQLTAREADEKTHALMLREKESLVARVPLQTLEKIEPNKFPHWIDYWSWRKKLAVAEAVYSESVRLVMDASEALRRAKEASVAAIAAIATAIKVLANTKQEIDRLNTQRDALEKQLIALRKKYTEVLLDKDKKTKALESAELQEKDILAKEEAARKYLTDLAGRVEWYENTRAVVIDTFQASSSTIIVLVVVVLGGPPALKVFWFFIIAGFAKSASSIRYETNESGSVIAAAEGKILEAPFSKEWNLASRSDWVKSWPPKSRRSTMYLWDWRAPTISYVAGLKELTCFTMEEADVTSTVSLGCGDDPHMHIFRLDLADHPGFILRPDRVVAISGNLRIRTKWNFINLHSWVCGSFRKILFCGTGTLYIRGYGGVNAIDCSNSPRNVEENFVIGYDSRSVFRTVRTETFWPYFRNKTSLFDYSFLGPGLALSEIAKPPGAKASDNPLKRTLDAIINGIGKLLGF